MNRKRIFAILAVCAALSACSAVNDTPQPTETTVITTAGSAITSEEDAPSETNETNSPETSSAENDTAEETEEQITDNTTVISKDGTAPSAAVVEKVFDGSVSTGDVFIVEEDEAYYVVEVLDLFADENYLSDNESSILM